MSFKAYTIPSFDKQLKRLAGKYPSLASEYTDLITSLEADPTQGTSLGRGCYKVRLAIASKGKGKSGGARVISYVKVVKESVYLLSIFDKSEQEAITKEQLTALLRELE